MSDIDKFKARFRRLIELRIEKDIDETKAAKSKAAFQEYEQELWAEIQEAGVVGSQTFDFGGDLGTVRFTPRQPTLYGRILNPETALKALEAEGLDDVIFERSIRKGRLNELVRDRIESRQPIPEGVDYYDSKGITISRKR